MKWFYAIIVAIFAITTASAQKTISLEGADETVRLWDNTTAQYSNYQTKDEKWRKKNCMIYTSSCELYIYKAAPEKNTGIAVAIYPGGSFTSLHLGISTAKW